MLAPFVTSQRTTFRKAQEKTFTDGQKTKTIFLNFHLFAFGHKIGYFAYLLPSPFCDYKIHPLSTSPTLPSTIKMNSAPFASRHGHITLPNIIIFLIIAAISAVSCVAVTLYSLRRA